MPNGRFNPSTKISLCSGLPSLLIPRKTRTSPVSLSATKKSPLGAVRISLGSFSPEAYKSTLNPSGTCGHAFSGRSTNFGPLPADGVTNGAGRSFSVILRNFPGFSKRKSVNGAVEIGKLASATFALAVAEGTYLGAFVGAALPLPKDFTYVTIFHRSPCGKPCHEGIPLSMSPLVTYHKTSPSAADCVRPLASEGIFPVPSPVSPWQIAQRA